MRRALILSAVLLACGGAVAAAYALGKVPARAPRAVAFDQTFDMVPGERVTIDNLELTFVRTSWGTAKPELRHRLTDVHFSVRRAHLDALEADVHTAVEINDGIWSGLDAQRVRSHWVEFVDGTGDRIRLRVLPFPDPPKISRDEASAIALRAADTGGFGAQQTMNQEQRGNVWRVEVIGLGHDRSRIVFVSADDGRVLAQRDVSHN